MAYSKKEKDEIIKRVCEFITNENKSLRKALMLHDMPNRDTFNEWLKESDQYARAYACACEERQEALFDEILEISDDNALDVTVDDEGVYSVQGEIVQRSKMRADNRKWALSKMNPKKYGNKVDVTTDGKAITNPMFGSNPLNE